jgi:hypothetical protein
MLKRLVLMSVTILLSTVSSACLKINPNYAIPDICAKFAEVPFTPVIAPDPNDPTFPKTGFEEVGVIKVMHGFGTAQLTSGKRLIKVEQGVTVPNYANQATVFLNGWRLNYLGGDQNVGQVGTLITAINLDQRTKRLTWTAAGQLSDNDFKEGYKFTYHYTAIAWNNVALNMVADHRDCAADTDFPHNAFISFSNGTTAMSSFSSFRQPLGIAPNDPVAVLPRGFAFDWPDRKLLQIAYSLDHTEVFAEKDKRYVKNHKGQTLAQTRIGVPAPLPTVASRVDSGFVSWDTHVIYKDNVRQRDYVFVELTSALGGSDVGLVQPPFSILPKEDESAGTLAGGVQVRPFEIENIPYAIAIPMLTGWELAYVTTNQKVKDVGIWLDEWTYTPGPSGGKLTYVVGSILGDDDNQPPHVTRHRLSLLGLRPLLGQRPKAN